MINRLAKAVLLSLACVAVAAPVSAHTGHDSMFALRDGLLHPIHGLDHLLAMVAVGLLAWQMGGRARFALPATFVSVMAVGAAASANGLSISMAGAELTIVASVVVLGLAIALRAQAPLAMATTIVGAFAFMHGYAHGAEIPAGAGFAGYALGFVTGTAVLHAAGLGLGWQLARSATAVRVLGALIALAGVGLAAA